MSPKLKPLLLPQLVEERKKMEVQHLESEYERQCVYYTHNSSSSDVASPVTPTFSTRGHMRGSSSTSSLDLPPMCLDSPASPVTPGLPPAGAAPSSHMPSKRPLPDVEEEPTERDDQDTVVSDQFDLYDCLGDEDPHVHYDNSSDMFLTGYPMDHENIDYDYGFASDSDYLSQSLAAKRKADLAGIADRFSNRFPSLSRWTTSAKRSMSQTTLPTTEANLERTLSYASSRSSSMSAPSRRRAGERISEPPLPTTYARSAWASDENVAARSAVDLGEYEDEDELCPRASLQRERALAATPLLPPLLDGFTKEDYYESPLQSPSVVPSAVQSEAPTPQRLSRTSAPTLSARPSISSFRPSQDQITIPSFLQEHDEWSDRLGHANFTISPQPYRPEEATLDSLQQLLSDWEVARVNFTKHIVRTGENYGETSKIYALTEAKWAEIDREWREAHEITMKNVPSLASKTEDPLPSFVSVRNANQSSSRSRSRGRGRGRADSSASMALPPPATNMASMIPRLADTDGKFPERGDEDIVGPMVREAYMARTTSEDRKSRFWKHIADKVGLRR